MVQGGAAGTSPAMTTAIVWLRRDLRLADNPAIHAAVAGHASVLPVYIHAPEEEAPWMPGAASRWWLHHSLAALDDALRERGASLYLAKGPSLESLRRLIKASGAVAVYWNRQYEPAALARDREIKQRLRAEGVAAQSYNSALLVEPWALATREGRPYRVFTPYWRAVEAHLADTAPWPAPSRIPMPAAEGSLPLDALELRPRIAWDAGLRDAWRPGEEGAHALLREFVADSIGHYGERRDRPDVDGTSRLSPYLHAGELSPRQILAALRDHLPISGSQGFPSIAAPYVRELGWREFSYHLLFHHPDTPERSLNAQFERFPWREPTGDLLERWQQGHTGIPIVDAGMRQLWKTGWMHNRVRMLVASLLSKNLRIHWSHGARWFWDTLVDADLANNTQGWQWTAGCGADAAPFFRIFNPVVQALRFDPRGEYIRRWVPELRDLPAPLLHEPWREPGLLGRIGYAAPMVDLASSRDEALAAYQAVRANR